MVTVTAQVAEQAAVVAVQAAISTHPTNCPKTPKMAMERQTIPVKAAA